MKNSEGLQFESAAASLADAKTHPGEGGTLSSFVIILGDLKVEVLRR